jgi:hypothetical protein
MGFNAGLAGFRDAQEMVSQMMRSENEQIVAMASFMRATGMHAALQRRDWTDFARRYNGPGFATNRYDEKLAAADTSLSSKGLPDLKARAVQLLLTYHGFNPGKIDGVVGGLPGQQSRRLHLSTSFRQLKITRICRLHCWKCCRLRRMVSARVLPPARHRPAGHRIFELSNLCSNTSTGTPEGWMGDQGCTPGTLSPGSNGRIAPARPARRMASCRQHWRHRQSEVSAATASPIPVWFSVYL